MQIKSLPKYASCFLFYTYCVSTLFIGISVKSYYGLEPEEGLAGTIHFLSIPFLLTAYLLNYKQCHFNLNEKILFSLFFGALFISRIIGGHSANIGLMVNIVLEPVLLISFMRGMTNFNHIIVRYLIILFIIVEASVAVWEIINFEPLFMQETNIITDNSSFLRAYALHGHPLMNAFLVCISCTALLFSKESPWIRFSVFLAGTVAVLAFNTRSSMLIMGILLLYYGFKQLLNKRISLMQKVAFLAVITFSFNKVADFAIAHDMGGRISISLGKDDGSANARYQLVDVVLSSSPLDLIVGRDAPGKIADKYAGMATIENSFLILTFYWGLLVVIPYFFYLYKDIQMLRVEKSLFIPWVFVMFLLLNVNNALGSQTPVMPVALLSLIAFSDIGYQNANTLIRNS